MLDNHNPHRILLDTVLHAENFQKYRYNSTEDFINIGVNSNHFHKLLKATKKKDTATLFIDNVQNDYLGIRITPKDNTRVTTSNIKIQNIQNIDIEVPDGYGRPIIVPSSEFQKAIKDINNIGQKINVISGKSYIKLECDASNIYSRNVMFGEIEDNDEEPDYNQDFDTEQLMRIIKISGLSNNIKIHAKKGLPLLLQTRVGSLGTMSVYIKSKQQIEDEESI
jgi:hypothetical protein